MKKNAPKPFTDDEFEKKLKKLSFAERRNASKLYQKYLEGETQKWQEQKLYNWGLIKVGVDNPEVGADDVCDTMEALAIRMRQHYQNPDGSNQLIITITKKVISDLSKSKTKESAANPPPGTLSGAVKRYSLKAWCDWFDKYVFNSKRASGGATLQKQQIEDPVALEQQEKIDAIKHRQWERAKEKGEFIHRSVALATGIAAVKEIHLLVKQGDERDEPKLRREKLLEMGFEQDKVELFVAWDKEQMRLKTDRRESEMQKLGMGVIPRE